MTIKIPQKVEFIMNCFMEAGYEAYVVGGCVRDAMLGRIPEDWDITTSARPMEIKQLFRRTIDTGIQHGTVTVMLEKEGFEVTTYRIDGEYEDSRHPKTIEFTASLIKDLERRDFTINAMAYNPKDGIVDVFDGQGDLERGILRCVGNPIHRFEEDALRMLRAIRFSGQLGFEIEEETKNAIKEKVDLIRNISAERIRTELDKLLLSNNPKRLILAYETGMTKIILPEFDCMMETQQNNPYHIGSVGEHSLSSVKAVNEYCKKHGIEKEKIHSILCWTMLLHDVGKPCKKTTDTEGIDHFYRHAQESEMLSVKILKRLKFDNDTIGMVRRLILWHDCEYGKSQAAIRRLMNCIGEETIDWLFVVQRADIMAKSSYQREGKWKSIEKAEEMVDLIRKSEDCITLKNLAVTGKDLIEHGFQADKSLGEALKKLLELVLENPEWNQKDILLHLAQEWRREH